MSSESPRRWLLSQVMLELGQDLAQIRGQVARRLQVKVSQVEALTMVRRSLDSRKRPRWVCSFEVELAHGARPRAKDARLVASPWQLPAPLPPSSRGQPVVVVGAGPAGLSCAHALATAGLQVHLVEQGAAVRERNAAVARLMAHGELDQHSNMCWGEGGAGTYSDGKLTTRRRDERLLWLLQLFAGLADDAEIALDAHPHLGTDRLVPMLERWHKQLEELGVVFHLGHRVESLLVRNGRAAGVRLGGDVLIEGRAVVVAPGHSARPLWQSLLAQGVALESAPFALGLRLEHPQEAVNRFRYRDWHDDPRLPPAEYSLNAHGPHPCHTFCMCPGGTVVPTPTEADGLVLNGMSGSRRGGRLANAAVVVQVRPQDCGPLLLQPAKDAALVGVALQRQLEQQAFVAGGGGFRAPGQRLVDFLAQQPSASLPGSSYHRGVEPARLDQLLPEFISQTMQAALAKWVQRHPGLLGDEALLLGVESRPSSPVRIPRGDNYQALSLPGLYPAGEGAGQASGITTCALDGLRVAEAVCDSLRG